MAKLILTLDGKVLCDYPLEKVLTTIGRRSTSDIHLDNLAVSGEHAAILNIGDDFYVEDVGSTNGTRVNAKLIKKHLLRHGDLIEFGKFQLEYLNEEAVSATPTSDAAIGFEKQVIADTLTSKSETPVLPDSATPPMAKNMSNSSGEVLAPAKIKVLNGSNAGRELILNKALTTLGKVGMQVAVITKRPQGYYITHVEGDIFPSVNGTSTGVQAFSLTHQDVIELAGVKMEFHFDTSLLA
ncbi:glycogen accumulation regulator GarA [mine drainage metagenome]|uniref:Glycogen accumulation regulator GarA n=1 Tax=mine drainage metagenome TaxID=410659 RepID=A0A1J5RTS4_9ZZZZ